jgi:diaminohydroxyphosphoribosylaminopyrimidine deaminase / 5-amino-6-(5-phosphoribosylamino)uracil reductase
MFRVRKHRLETMDAEHMQRALELARRSVGLSSPNPPVGCVIVRDGAVVGEGWHEYALREHAEIRALRAAGDRAVGSTVYLTLEPCSHHGRTPPCADQLLMAGVSRVVAARIDPNPAVSGRGIERLRLAGVQTEVGLLSEAAGELIEAFACHITAHRPLVVAKVGMSLDGRLAPPITGTSRWITSAEAREQGQNLRRELDAILVGIGTVLSDDPELTYRGPSAKSRALLRVILDSDLTTPPRARIFSGPANSVLICCVQGADPAHRAELESAGAEIVQLPGVAGGVDLAAVLDELDRRRILGVLVEGGSRIHGSFLAAGLVDKFVFFVAPLVLGGRALPAIGGAGYATVAEAPHFRIRNSYCAGPDTVLEAYPSGSRSILSPW